MCCANCCSTPSRQPDAETLSFLIDDAVHQLGLIRSRLYPLLGFVIDQCEIVDSSISNHTDKLFAETMLVTVRDLRDQVIDVQELLQRGKP